MKVGILGSGDVGIALAEGFLELGAQVKIGSRTPAKLREWVKTHGSHASAGDMAETAAFGEIIVLAVLGTAVEEVVQLARLNEVVGKVIIDTTNPLDFSQGMPPTLFTGGTDSLGERIQRLAPAARVVKAFNIVGHALMVHPRLPGGPPDMFLCGNDADAKGQVIEILQEFGWTAVDIGNITGARYLEPMAMVWVLSAFPHNSWMQAFKMLHAES